MRACVCHEALEALLLEFFGDRAGQFVRLRAVDRRIGERADAIELGLVEKREQFLELASRSRPESRR